MNRRIIFAAVAFILLAAIGTGYYLYYRSSSTSDSSLIARFQTDFEGRLELSMLADDGVDIGLATDDEGKDTKLVRITPGVEFLFLESSSSTEATSRSKPETKEEILELIRTISHEEWIKCQSDPQLVLVFSEK